MPIGKGKKLVQIFSYYNDSENILYVSVIFEKSITYFFFHKLSRGGSQTLATAKMEFFVALVNGWKPLTNVTKSSILDITGVLDTVKEKNIIFNML